MMDELKDITNDDELNVTEEKPSEELEEALKELENMEEHPEENKVYHNVEEMFDDIINE